MTTRYVALLRGVNNIGATKRVAMADLCALFEELGFCDVRTVINSGNVIFSAANKGRGDVLARIEKGLVAKLGMTSQVVLLSGREIATAVRGNPFSAASPNPSDVLVMVLRARSDQRRLRPLLKQPWRPEALSFG